MLFFNLENILPNSIAQNKISNLPFISMSLNWNKEILFFFWYKSQNIQLSFIICQLELMYGNGISHLTYMSCLVTCAWALSTWLQVSVNYSHVTFNPNLTQYVMLQCYNIFFISDFGLGPFSSATQWVVFSYFHIGIWKLVTVLFSLYIFHYYAVITEQVYFKVFWEKWHETQHFISLSLH